MSDDVRAAGGVLWRDGVAGPEVAVIHRPRYDDWSLPKGKLDKGEPFLLAALREIREETGYDGQVGVCLGSTSYPVEVQGRTVSKTVRWWSVRAGDGDFEPGPEVDELRWLSVDEAVELLPDSLPLRRWVGLPRDLAIVLLVRHASAGDPHEWNGPDDLRPLDGKGIGQAELLAGILPSYRPGRIISAPPVRCRQTMDPLAQALGLAVELDDLLGEDGAPARPHEHVLDLAVPGAAVVLCSQGGVIPRVVRSLDSSRPHPAARKGSVWTLALDRRALVVADDSVLQ